MTKSEINHLFTQMCPISCLIHHLCNVHYTLSGLLRIQPFAYYCVAHVTDLLPSEVFFIKTLLSVVNVTLWNTVTFYTTYLQKKSTTYLHI